MILDTSPGVMSVIVAMAIVTLLLRWSGFYLIGKVKVGPRLEAGFRALSGSVAAATFTPLVIADGPTAFLAVLITAIMARMGRSDFLTLIVAVALAVLLRQVGL